MTDLQPAKVTATAPLQVAYKTAPETNVPVQWKPSGLTLSIGDDVLVGVFDRRLTIVMKAVAA